MVLGNGLVAGGFKAYEQDERYLIFASGVSNSTSRDIRAFAREKDLLKKTIGENPEKILIYFGTCSIYDESLQDSPYVIHKLEMESMVAKHNHYHIFRISNLAGKTNNPHTVLNFFVQHIRSGDFFFAWKNASRNIIDLDDAVAVCSHIITQGLFKNEIVNIANPANYPVTQIIRAVEETLRKKGNYELIDKGNAPVINTQNIQKIFPALNIYFDDNYLNNVIKKYFIE